MIYNSSLFLLYFLPAVLITYYLIDRKYKNLLLLLVSIFFYAWGAPKFVFILAGSVIADYFLLQYMSKQEGHLRRILFWTSVILNLGLLLYFKYMNFFVEQFNALIGIFGSKPAHWTNMLLPLGISFITFQKLAYTFDIKRKVFEPFSRIQDYALYIFMFPQLLSGPIVRPGHLAGQIAERPDSVDDKLTGFYRFVIGLAKKVLIADVLAVQVNEIFALNSQELSTGLAWTGAIGYTFQIYFDFSGYTDMAIGLARMLGFRLPENFNSPYVSTSITDFWHRWHITLSTWFRDYLFLPLAYATSRKLPRERYFGLRADKVIYVIATLVTFLLCGFWHGAAWTFILWGLYQGIFLALDKLFLIKYLKKAGKVPSIVITFFIILFGWVLFRSNSIDDFYFYVRRMFSFTDGVNDVWINSKFWTMLAIAAFFSFAGVFKRVADWQERLYLKPGNAMMIGFSLIAILLFILSEAAITSTGFSPFIYFRF